MSRVSITIDSLCLLLLLYTTHNIPLAHTQPPGMERKLNCYYYNAGRNPRLIIRPAKIEVAYFEPKVYVLRDILTQREMARLKELGGPVVSGSSLYMFIGILVVA